MVNLNRTKSFIFDLNKYIKIASGWGSAPWRPRRGSLQRSPDLLLQGTGGEEGRGGEGILWFCPHQPQLPGYATGGLTVTFDFERLPEIKNIFIIRKPIQDFLSNSYRHFLSISYRFWDIWLQSFQGLTLTCTGHLGSKLFSAFESPYMTSYINFY